MGREQETVAFFGDSLTRADYLPEGFVDMLAHRWPEARVLNFGVNGETTDDLLRRVRAVAAEQPDLIFLMIGTNDVGWGIPAAHFRNNLRMLVESLRPAKVVLITPTTSVFIRGANAPFVAAVKEVAAGGDLPVIDFAAAIQDSDYGEDGLHWNEIGHQRLADMIDAWRSERAR